MVCRFALSFVILALASFVLQASEGNDGLPNVIIILSDDQGWADIGYNNPNAYTPNLDNLARTGAKFTQHYVMPQCTPTRVALMTGRYPSRFGGAALAASNQPAFPKGTPTIASMFQSRGYETFLCGKWHLGSSAEHGPNHFGFDHSYGSLTGAIGMYDHRYRDGKFCETWHRDHELIEGFENGIHATDLVAQEAIKIIEAKRDSPFFLYVPFHSIHTPLDERGTFVDRPTQLDPDQPERWLDEDEIEWFNDPTGVIQREVDPEKRLLLASAYHLDHVIGEMIAALDRSGHRENTLVLFSSDNGPQVSWGGNAYPDDLKLTDFNQPLPMRGKKVDVWEGGIHVPGFANWPGKIEAKTVDDPVHIVDWFPTLANLIEFQPGQQDESELDQVTIGWDGTDISRAVFASEPLLKRDLYWNWNTRTNRWALRFGHWKIVKYGVGAPTEAEQWQLYHLKLDPKEKDDVGSENPDVRLQLHERYLEHRKMDKVDP